MKVALPLDVAVTAGDELQALRAENERLRAEQRDLLENRAGLLRTKKTREGLGSLAGSKGESLCGGRFSAGSTGSADDGSTDVD